MKDLEKKIKKMDFQYFGTGSHVISASAFFAKEDAVLLDVRTPEEIENIKLPLQSFCTVLEIPVNELPDRIKEVPKDKFVGIFCSGGIRASMMFTYLIGMGYDKVKIIPGGYSPFLDELKTGKIFKKINNK